jgi:hypothetical protein
MQLWKSQPAQQALGRGRTFNSSRPLLNPPRAAGAATAATDKATVLPRNVDSMVQQAAAAVQRLVQGVGVARVTTCARHPAKLGVCWQLQGWHKPLADFTNVLLDLNCAQHSETHRSSPPTPGLQHRLSSICCAACRGRYCWPLTATLYLCPCRAQAAGGSVRQQLQLLSPDSCSCLLPQPLLCRAQAAGGSVRQQLQLLNPVNEKEVNFMATEAMDYPCRCVLWCGVVWCAVVWCGMV